MKIIHTLILFLCALCSFSAMALEFQFGEYKLADQGLASCFGHDGQSCQIEFDKPFTTKPLVFLMPTITEGDGRDAPATLRLIDVTTTGATFRQYIAPLKNNIKLEPMGKKCSPNTNTNYCLETIPMQTVRYFAIEPGTLNLGERGRIEAGSIDVNKYLAGKGGNYRNITTPLNYSREFDHPGILVSIQGYGMAHQLGDEAQWITPIVPLVDTDSHRAYVALDRSELRAQGHYTGTSREVAYIVAEGRGTYKGLQFAMGAGETENTLSNDLKKFDQVTKSVLRQCEETSDIPYGFSELPFIIASKNSRLGPNGGWLRLCRLEAEEDDPGEYEVSFVNDEDLYKDTERKHHDEEIGFMAFQRKVSEDTCDVFPGPAQTWEWNGNRNKAFLRHEALITGTYAERGNRYLWFRTAGNGRNNCDGEQCNFPGQAQPNRWAKKLELGDFVEASRNAPWYTGDNTLTEYSTFAMGNHTAKTEVLRDGAGEKIRLLDLNNGTTLHLYPGTYWFETININSSSHIVTHGKVVIHTKQLTVGPYSTLSPINGVPDSVQIYAHTSYFNAINVDLSKGSKITGLVYSEGTVTMAGGQCSSRSNCEVTSVTGAVTAARLEMNSSSFAPSTVINGKSSCFETTPDFELSLSPTSEQNLLCDSQQILLSLAADNGSGIPFDGEIQVTIRAKQGKPAAGHWSTREINASNPGVSFRDGETFSLAVSPAAKNQIPLWFTSDHLGELTVTATIEGLSGPVPTGSYQFLPGGFTITPNPVPLVAGMPSTITIKAMACSSGDSVINEYTGPKALTFSTDYNQPAVSNSRHDAIFLANTAGTRQWQRSSGSFAFHNGVAANIPIFYQDAGELTLTVSDPTCTKDKCDIAALTGSSVSPKQLPSGWDGLVGTATVYSRPYTFALCRSGLPDIEKANGTSRSGNGFIAAGETFNTVVKPVIWQSGDRYVSIRDPQAAVDSSGMCGRLVTENFYHQQAPRAQVSLTHTLMSPAVSGAVAGTLMGGEAKPNTALKSQPFALSWSEVGSIKLTADTADSYLGMDINPGYREVGRFYPKYFQLNSDSFSYPSGQSGFAYMDQPFSINFSVGAFAKGAGDIAGNAVKNYRLFADANKAGVELMVADVTQPEDAENTLAPRVEYATRAGAPYTWAWPGSAWIKGDNGDSLLNVDDSQFTFVRHYTEGNRAADMRVSQPDGPFDATNTRMGLFIKPAHDPLDWSYTRDSEGESELKVVDAVTTQIGQRWHSRPDIRYGRMVMDDVGGRSFSQLAIPLRTEYWNGMEFERNHADNISQFDGRYACKQVLAQSDNEIESASYTLGAGHVVSGNTDSGDFIAIPHQQPLYREQVRFWQKLVSTQPGKVKPDDNVISCEAGHVSRNGQSQPWLLYNWRGLGDENPSALVTFGAHRGNDRVIYRGEKGINTLLN
ncbi:DUF6701 domain-containing protein [Photobacterium nomapromontoriensis]|uniref:DUF6701 domain-containing protein n=1 Tax=Photobacterium nomapromontoriensis TaxID=2910237 RepID=UPI003D0B19A0